MYVGKQVTVTSKFETVLPYHCKQCGYNSEAVVIGVGQGAGNSPYFMNNSGAQEKAHSRATSAAEKNAELTLSLKRCPKCGGRDEASVRGFWLKSILGLVGVSLFLLATAGLIFAIDRKSWVFWIFGPLALITPLILYKMTVGWKWSTVDQRVAFLDE